MMHKNVGTARAAGCVGTHARAATSRRRHMCERRGNARTPLRWYCVSHYIGRSAFEFAPGSEIKSGDRQPDHYRRLLPPYFTHAHPARRRDELNLTSLASPRLASPRNAKPRNAKPRLASPGLPPRRHTCVTRGAAPKSDGVHLRIMYNDITPESNMASPRIQRGSKHMGCPPIYRLARPQGTHQVFVTG